MNCKKWQIYYLHYIFIFEISIFILTWSKLVSVGPAQQEIKGALSGLRQFLANLKHLDYLIESGLILWYIELELEKHLDFPKSDYVWKTKC